MRTPSVQPIDRKRSFDISELFFSTTDRKGIVTGCNEIFTRIAAYPPSEILKQPHNIIRHPDMPRAVFKLLWDYLLDGRPIGAYVKNLAKTGEYYWVFALAMPFQEGFLSIRLKPSSPILSTINELYPALLNLENSFEPDWKAGMEAATERLLGELSALGFESYDDFMAHALHLEIESRRAATRDATDSLERKKAASDAFSEIGTLIELRGSLSEMNRYFESLGSDINRIAINASISAVSLGDDGRALAVISQEISQVAGQITSASSRLAKEVMDLSKVLFSTSFMISFATLLSEMRLFFRKSNQNTDFSLEEQKERYGASFDKLTSELDQCYKDGARACKNDVEHLGNTLRSFQTFINELSKILLKLQLGYVTGKSISSAVNGGENFSQFLEDMVSCSSAAREKLSALKEAVDSIHDLIDKWTKSGQFSA